MKIGAAGPETFWRFKQLMRCGYQPNYEFSDEQAFWFDHPRKSLKHRAVGLYPSGTVRSLPVADDEMTFERWEKERFAEFIRSVPSPNWREKIRHIAHGTRSNVLDPWWSARQAIQANAELSV